MKLIVNNLSAGYNKRQIIKNIKFSMETGEIVCLLGPNGSGKTTLFKAILGLIPSNGEIYVNDSALSNMSCQQRAKIFAYIPQIHVPPFPFTVMDVVAAGRTPFLKTFRSPEDEDLKKSFEALELLNITHLANRTYTQLSGGERQLVLISRALAQSPNFLIMDEPTSYLDYGNQLRTIQIIRKLAHRNMGIILTTHYPDHAFMCSSRVLAFRDGNIISGGKPEEVLNPSILNQMYGVDINIINLSENRYMCSPAEGVFA
ncbi:MAG TPA: ABC transporter ATP-binding protein [Chitinispirillaceae bacterium]|nr:ABC transporter ATP-binding protein [Chitinispirillaceae bacterium]